MEQPLKRPARPGDAADLARNWVDVARHYAELDPDAFQVPGVDGLVAWFEELLRRPRPEDAIWLVAELDASVVGSPWVGVIHRVSLCNSVANPRVGTVALLQYSVKDGTAARTRRHHRRCAPGGGRADPGRGGGAGALTAAPRRRGGHDDARRVQPLRQQGRPDRHPLPARL